MAKKTSSKSTTTKRRTSRGLGLSAGDAKGKNLVIVESPSKAKTINKYLGGDYLVVASIGHVRDLPSRNPKGTKSDVPGVDLEDGFRPTYEVLSGKDKVVRELKRAARECLSSGQEVWFATDLDREGEAIAWHLAEELGISPEEAKRVVFGAITRSEIERAFSTPHPIDQDKVNAQQARRILDRIVGYQVSPLLWKKVARGLSAGRVQSVAVRLVVERERQIMAFVPDEYWQVTANFALSEDNARKLGPQWLELLAKRNDKGNPPTQKQQNGWLGRNSAIRAELVEVGGAKFDIRTKGGDADAAPIDLTDQVRSIAEAAGFTGLEVTAEEDTDGKGPARWRRTLTGQIDPSTPYAVRSIETKRTTSRPSAPFITSTLQQAASSRMSFGAQRTMRAAQQLYEGVEIPGEGPVGLITYMRTDSTHLSKEAVEMVRGYVASEFGNDYLPDKPNTYSSSNKAAQEAHEAIRPTSMDLPPARVKGALKPDQFKVYSLIWERFVACQMSPAKWDATTVLIEGGKGDTPVTFKATGRVLVFDGFYKVAGIPMSGDTATLPELNEQAPLSPFWASADQKFTSPPARYTEASLIKMLESEGIGRPSTYADIIQKIQDRKYVEQLDRRFYATDLGEVVTDKLLEAFPRIMDIGYTRSMEDKLDQIEEEHLDWIEMLRSFYDRFKVNLESAMENLAHAKAEVHPAPEEYRCGECEASLVYRFGRNGRFLSCSRYPDCNYACPCDRQGRPRPPETTTIACPKCSTPMTRRNGRYGPFLGCSRYNDETDPCDGIVNLDKQGRAVAPSPPPYVTDLPCPTCESPLNLRAGIRGPWLGCSRFPKCRGRGKWRELEDEIREKLEKALAQHEKKHPVIVIKTIDGTALTDAKGKPLETAPPVDSPELILSDNGDAQKPTARVAV